MDKTIRICRLCLESKKPSEASMDDETFRARLTTVSNFLFEENEQLPSAVCSECSKRVNQFYTFMETVRCNQEQLRLSLPPTQVKNEIFLESSYEEFESPVKKEEQSPEHKTETMDLEVEMYADEYLSAEEKSEAEEEPASSLSIEDEISVEITDEDRLIKDFLSLKCDTCSESFETLKHLKSHAKKVHDTQAVLQCCNKSFSLKHKMLFHINTHLKPCKCNECGKGFPDKHTLKVHHIVKHTSSEEKQFKCEKCNRSFQTEQILRTHRRLHDRVECPICKKSLSNVYTLKSHMSGVHNDERKFICDVCGKDFKSREALNSHSVLHTGLKREDGARCEICHTWISRKKQLRRHMIEIHQAKEVTCGICHKVYPNEKSLTTHKGRVHVDDKFECEICGKRFKRNVNLKEHRASHTGQKLYSCEFCGMEMNSNGNLYSHKKNKHPEEWMQAKRRAAKFTDEGHGVLESN
ncbi:zinc finger protein 391-like isoform X2 [Ochlerotatus camptorhynchus]|uniref:zinc finger protein 391-like isoform X2 n=1 Tax=Ochlerotatus camptorhynchus TaxID=644619 RepID=UPI0031D2590F